MLAEAGPFGSFASNSSAESMRFSAEALRLSDEEEDSIRFKSYGVETI
jgi:hypothetical protein